jgi:hypothetical protein
MKLILKDLIKLAVLSICWILAKYYLNKNNLMNFSEALNYAPIFLIITIGYYAGMSVCMNVINIKNCDKEYSEIIEDIDEARKFYSEKNILYN